MDLAEKLSAVDHTCYTELENYLTTNGEHKEEHMRVMKDVLKHQMKAKTLVNIPQPPQGGTGGAEYIQEVLMSRCGEVLMKILSLLKAKSSETQFVKSKEELQEAMGFITDLKNANDKVACHIQEYDIVEI